MSNEYHLLVQKTIQYLQENYTSNSSLFFDRSILDTIPPSEEKTTEPLRKKSVLPPIAVAQQPSTPQKKEPILNPPPLAPEVSSISVWDQLQKQISHLFPHFPITKEIPKDSKALILAQEWQHKNLEADVIILSFREGKETDLFLQSLQKAISLYLYPAKIIDADKWDKEGKWPLLFEKGKAKWVVCSPALLKKRSLLPFYKEIPATSERFFGPFPLFMIDSFETYFQTPSQKKTLWQSLCAVMKPVPALS